MMGALLMLGLQPGPMLFVQHPQVAWGLIASMFIGNIILAVVNIPLAGMLVRLLAIPPRILYPVVMALAFVGTYAITHTVISFYILVIFGLVGYFMHKGGIPSAPLILAVIVGDKMEQSFRQALTIADGSFEIFVRSSVSKTLILLTILSLLYPVIQSRIQKKRMEQRANAG
jgi:putative tricarboxylic transport membrane protein